MPGLSGTACSRRLIVSSSVTAICLPILGTRRLVAVSTTPHEVPPPPSGTSPAQLGGYSSAATQTNTLAVISLVAGIGSFFAHIIPVVGGFTVAVIAIVTGFMARGQIKQTGEQGMWMANVGIIIGFVHIALGFILLMVVLVLIFVVGLTLSGIAAHSGSPSPSP